MSASLDHSGKRVLVLGLGMTGLSMARWLAERGASVTVADTRSAPPCARQLALDCPDVPVRTGAFDDALFADVDMIALSPGIPAQEASIAAARARGVDLVGDIELFARALPAIADAVVLAITGTNGKSTVTEMAGAICRAAGRDTVVAGNIGVPVLDILRELLGQPQRCRAGQLAFVLELSSFQLETTNSLDAQVAACLNLSEDHLDRYPGMREYAQAKARVFNGSGVQVINRQDAAVRAMARAGRPIHTFGLDAPAGDLDWGLSGVGEDLWLAQGAQRLMPMRALQVAGMHNVANALAALALVRAVDLPYEASLDALRRFEGLPHRVQKVAEVDGVIYYDDSKGTNVGATVAAINGMRQQVVLIAGGDGKDQDFAPLAPAVANRARAVVLIGRDREKIAAVLQPTSVPLLRAGSMEEAVHIAARTARQGDAVLLSPACASFDMFRNYEHRAQVFVQAVHQVAAA